MAVGLSPVQGFHNLIMVAMKGTPHPVGLNTLAAYEASDEAQKKSGKGFAALTPEFQGEYRDPIQGSLPAGATIADVQAFVVEKYKEVAAEKLGYGPFGDYLQVSVVGISEGVLVSINQIAYKAFPKPAVATDLGLFIKGFHTLESGEKEAVIYGVFIKRMLPPGAGHEATAGGFNNIGRDKETGFEYFASPISTAMKEGSEEILSRIRFDKQAAQDYNLHDIEGTINLGKLGTPGQLFKCAIKYIGCFKTSDALVSQGGEVIDGSNGKKRVHITHGVLATVNMPEDVELSKELVENSFRAADDALKVIVSDVTNEISLSSTTAAAKAFARDYFISHEMGIKHHETVLASLFEHAHRFFYPAFDFDPSVPSSFNFSGVYGPAAAMNAV